MSQKNFNLNTDFHTSNLLFERQKFTNFKSYSNSNSSDFFVVGFIETAFYISERNFQAAKKSKSSKFLMELHQNYYWLLSEIFAVVP